MTRATFIESPEQWPIDLQPYIQKASRVFVLTDENTTVHCLPLLLQQVDGLSDADIVEVACGEASKSIEIAGHIWAHLLENKADRHCLIILLGGGIISDLGGFIAATYKRGVSFIVIPTSLLAMTDAAIGGKNGIDYDGYKNAIGTFAHPEAIFIDPSFLTTLPEKEWKCGFAEMIKHALIADARLWERLMTIKSLGVDTLSPYLTKSIDIKENIVLADWKENSIRQWLNFGHTIGHALESFFMQRATPLSHGEAVAYGMIVEIQLSVQHLQLDEHTAGELCQMLLKWFPATAITFPDFKELEPFLFNDKKIKSGKITWILLKKIGQAEICQDVPLAMVKSCYDQSVAR